MVPDMTDAESVKQIIESKLQNYKFINVSNREPYIHTKKNGDIKCNIPAGGLTAALDPLMQACGGTWIAWGSGDADKEVVDDKDRVQVPPDSPKYVLKRVWMTKDEVNKFYFGFANQTLWPICHYVYQKPVFDPSFWETYRHVNQLYAKAILEEIEGHENVFLWVQDYQLALVPELIRNSEKITGKNIVISDFWHIPWPSWEIFLLCPSAKEILKGLLGNDLIGFHLPQYCDNFLENISKILNFPVDYDKGNIEYDGRTIKVKPFPISVDFEAIDSASRKKEVEDEIKRIRSDEFVPFPYIGVGVDRLDYTKGIIERFNALDWLLEKKPDLQEKFVFVEAGAPSRGEVPAYQQLNRDIIELVDKINNKYEKNGWKPIIYLEKKLDYSTLLALYRTADLCIVSSLHDGMNLVAKEFLSANVDEKGVLILSKFAGAAKELEESLLINPYDIQEFAEAINQAITMSPEKRKESASSLRKIVKENNIYKWLQDFIMESTKNLGR
jgi:alpha,alpha-trehalose-phosphate synthase [UDP-forming]